MGASAPSTFRLPLILLALVNLAILGNRLWPWPEVLNLPVNGTTAIDPAVSLIAYGGLIFWLGGNRDDGVRRALGSGVLLGVIAGLFLAGRVVYEASAVNAEEFRHSPLHLVPLLAAMLLWGLAGLRGVRATGNAGMGLLSGVWSAMVSCLMACTAVLAEMSVTDVASPVSPDLWKQYEGLAIGSPATQALVHSLNTATWFLLVGPLMGAALGFVFASVGHKDEK